MINRYLKEGYDIEMQEDKEAENKKKGNLRGGSCGAKKDGMFIGGCPRKALLRKLGFQKLPSQSTDMIFEAGRANEEFIKRRLSKVPDLVIVENDYSLELNDAFKSKWTGRTDFYCKRKDGSEFLIESKCMVSKWTVKDNYINDHPKLLAVIQLANYMRASGVYEGYVVYSHYFIAEDGFGAKRIKWEPKFLEWQVDIHPNTDKTITYTSLQTGFETDTGLTFEHIDEFYKSIEKAEEDNLLPDRPFWAATQKYSDCAYCDFSLSCDRYDEGSLCYKDFIKEVELDCK